MTTESNPAPRLRVSWFGRSVVGCVRQNNEDALWAGDLATASVAARTAETEEACFEGAAALARPGTILAVADGMGGAKAGEIASSMAVSILSAEMLRRAPTEATAEADVEALTATFIEVVEHANDEIRAEGSRNPERQGMGTTLTAIWAVDDIGQMVHVGDSRAYLFRKGNLKRLTKDQSLVEKLLEDKIISPEEARRMNARNIILQALGSEDDLDVAHPRTQLEADDTVLLCTDGLTGVLEDDAIEESLRAGGTLDEMCARLIRGAEDGGGPDNITALLGRIESAHQA